MNKRYWSGINKESNVFGFGCWQIAGVHSLNGAPNGWGKVEEFEAIELLCFAIANGIDFFDTAQGYNFGKSERLLGEALKQIRKEVIVCTKIALTEKEVFQGKIGEEFKLRVIDSMNNLAVTRIDIVLIHNPPDDINWKNFDYEILHELVNEKLIGTFGVSSRGLKGAINAVTNNVGTTLEWVLNLFERRPVKDLFPILEEKKMNFIARSPLSRGLINPIYIKNNPNFDSDDFRSTLPQEWISWVVHCLRTYHSNGVSENDILKNALLYCTQFDEVNATILGIKSKKQLEQYLHISRDLKSGFKFDPLFNIPDCYPKWA